MVYMSEDIDRYLRGVSYPADKSELVNNAISRDAPEDVVRNFDALPNKRFDSSEDVRRNIKKGPRMGIGSTRQGYSARTSAPGR